MKYPSKWAIYFTDLDTNSRNYKLHKIFNDATEASLEWRITLAKNKNFRLMLMSNLDPQFGKLIITW